MLLEFHVPKLVKATEKLNIIERVTNCEVNPELGTSLYFTRLSEIVECVPWKPLIKYYNILDWLKVTNMQLWQSVPKECFCGSHVWVKL